MTLLLQSRAFHKIPPANLQAVFMRMQRMSYSAGDTVIRQGGEGDYFYAIVDGRCVVTRETPLNREGVKLAELGKGDTFGEEALISGAKRNATVSMLTDGVVMRLGKDDFNTLLNEPMLQWVDVEEARALIGRGAPLARRAPSERIRARPLRQTRSTSRCTSCVSSSRRSIPSVSYVVCCDTGRRSSAAAYILSERGYDSYVLRGGIAATGPRRGPDRHRRRQVAAPRSLADSHGGRVSHRRVPGCAVANRPPPVRHREPLPRARGSAAAPPALSHCSKSPAVSGRET